MFKDVIILSRARFAYTDSLANSYLDIDKSEQLLFYSILCIFNKDKPREEFCISVRGIAMMTGKRAISIRKNIEDSVLNLRKKSLYKIPRETGEKWKGINIFNYLSYDSIGDRIVGRFTKAVIAEIMPDSQSLVYKVAMASDFKSRYSFPFLALIMTNFKLQEAFPPVLCYADEIIPILISPEKEKNDFNASDFNTNILRKAIKEINKWSCIKITKVDEVYEERIIARREVKNLLAYKFYVLENEYQPIEVYSDEETAYANLVREILLKK